MKARREERERGIEDPFSVAESWTAAGTAVFAMLSVVQPCGDDISSCLLTKLLTVAFMSNEVWVLGTYVQYYLPTYDFPAALVTYLRVPQ